MSSGASGPVIMNTDDTVDIIINIRIALKHYACACFASRQKQNGVETTTKYCIRNHARWGSRPPRDHLGTTPGPPRDHLAANQKNTHLRIAQMPFRPLLRIYILLSVWPVVYKIRV